MSSNVKERLEIVKMDAPIGAEVRGVDLSQPLDAETFAQIDDAYNRHTVLVFRDQKLTPEQQIAFGARFGPLEIHVRHEYLLEGHPEILVVSNVLKPDGSFLGLPDAGQTWHTDTSYRTKPSRGSILYALEVPRNEAGEVLGNTLFAGTAPAYEALSPELKAKIDGKRAIHRYAVRKRPVGSQRAKLTAEQLKETPDIAHPAVRTHPKTGRKALYLFEGECIGLEGMPLEEGAELIAELTAHIIQPQFTYRHKWQQGDVIMWDNAASLHLAIADYALPQRRLMHRVTVEGGVPV
ncbi:MAG TPA: TauD/TfdA family dioxygenase [Burkholderiales bacterium]|jgi:taurine dioxygenase|nr:TauD/TfdA family dioxygenase [Burkholderiales bacterium]